MRSSKKLETMNKSNKRWYKRRIEVEKTTSYLLKEFAREGFVYLTGNLKDVSAIGLLGAIRKTKPEQARATPNL
ncbi:hypothetical protein PGT21_007128 [Puccinia graminis f. sp. tritici]|uniref:Uncharacterized protein n=1 Tax=Puccinia graminis f. sp. tritici TaxID=56615 RepID=A0A5B0NMQ4_PUCGR|nr:hypothetical protein PGT21_007128 [Puccinia graminis f. sp. tritici]